MIGNKLRITVLEIQGKMIRLGFEDRVDKKTLPNPVSQI
jgi:sRNA-binding carbon storage regulator CsrA